MGRAKIWILTFLWMVSLPVVASRQRYHLPFYDQCAKLPTDTLMAMGDRYMRQQEYTDSALVCFSVVANRYYQHNLTTEEIEKSVWAMNMLGYLFKYSHFDYEKSYGFLVTALDISDKHHLQRYRPYIRQNLAPYYQWGGSREHDSEGHQDMMDCYQQAFDEAASLNDYKAMTSIFINLVNFSDGTDSLKHISKAFARFMRIPQDRQVEMYDFATALYEGAQCIEHREPQKALQWFRLMEQSVDTPIEGMAGRYRMMAVSKKMQAYFNMGDVDGALVQLDSLLTMAKHFRARDVIVDSYWVYYQYHRDQHHADEANRYFQLYLENKDSLLTYDKLTDITELNFQTQLNRAGEQVRTLSYKRRMQGYILTGVIAFTALIIAILIVLARSYRQLRIKNRQLYEKHEAMIAEMERTRQLQQRYETEQQEKAKYSGSHLDDDTMAVLQRRITHVLEDSDEIYAEDFSIKRLADLTGSNQAYVSQVINTTYGKTFTALISERRINEACRRLGDSQHYGDYTIEAISQSVGFKSRTSFVALFKKITGLTPSAYQKMALES